MIFLYSLDKPCSKQPLSGSLWKKVRRLEKSTPPPVVTWPPENGWRKCRGRGNKIRKIGNRKKLKAHIDNFTLAWEWSLQLSHYLWIGGRQCYLTSPGSDKYNLGTLGTLTHNEYFIPHKKIKIQVCWYDGICRRLLHLIPTGLNFKICGKFYNQL